MAEKFSGSLSIDSRLRAAVIPAIVLESTLTTHERMAIAVIAWHGEVAFPFQSRIAAMMGCSVRCTHSTLQSLKTKEWLEITPRRDKRGYKTSNHYRLRVPALTAPDAVSPNCTSCSADLHQVQSPNLNPDLNLNQESEVRRRTDAEAAPVLPLQPPAPVRIGSEATLLAKSTPGQQANKFLRECEQIIREEYGVPNAINWGRDTKAIVRLILQHGYEMVDRVATEELRWFMSHGRAWDAIGFEARFPKSKQRLSTNLKERAHVADKKRYNNDRD